MSSRADAAASVGSREQIGFSVKDLDRAIGRVFVVPREIQDAAPIVEGAFELLRERHVIGEDANAYVERSCFQQFVVMPACGVIRGPVRRSRGESSRGEQYGNTRE